MKNKEVFYGLVILVLITIGATVFIVNKFNSPKVTAGKNELGEQEIVPNFIKERIAQQSMKQFGDNFYDSFVTDITIRPLNPCNHSACTDESRMHRYTIRYEIEIPKDLGFQQESVYLHSWADENGYIQKLDYLPNCNNRKFSCEFFISKDVAIDLIQKDLTESGEFITRVILIWHSGIKEFVVEIDAKKNKEDRIGTSYIISGNRREVVEKATFFVTHS